MHVSIKLLFVSPPPVCTTCDVGVCIIEYAYRIYRCIFFDTLCSVYCIIRHITIKSGIMIWFTICEEYHYPLDVLTVGVCGFISLTLVHQRLCMRHSIISRCCTCRLKRIYLAFMLCFICSGIGFISADDLSVIVCVAAVFVGMITHYIRFVPREFHQRDPALFVRIRQSIVFVCCRVNKAVHRAFQLLDFLNAVLIRIIHTPRHIQHQHDIEWHCCLSHYLRCRG